MKKSILVLVLAISVFSESDKEISALVDSLNRTLSASVSLCTLAVFPFTDLSQTDQSAGTAVAERIISLLQKNPRFLLVDRQSFQKVMSEVALSQSGAIQDSSALQAGRTLAANCILTGTLANAFGNKRILARIIRTETSEILTSATVIIKADAMTDLQKRLMGERATVSASVFRSLLLPGWGQFYTDHPIRGTLAMSLCLGGLGSAIWAILAQSSAKSDYDAKVDYELSQAYAEDLSTGGITPESYKTERTELYKDYTSARDRMVLLLAVTGGLWGLNVLDAAIAGVQSKRSFQPYFSIRTNQEPNVGLVYSLKF